MVVPRRRKHQPSSSISSYLTARRLCCSRKLGTVLQPYHQQLADDTKFQWTGVTLILRPYCPKIGMTLAPTRGNSSIKFEVSITYHSGLASHWPCVTDPVVYPRLNGLRQGDEHPTYIPLRTWLLYPTYPPGFRGPNSMNGQDSRIIA